MKFKPRINKKAVVFMETITLILGVVFLVVVLYFFMAKGLAGPVRSATSETACTMSAYSRGILIDSMDSPVKTVKQTIGLTYLALASPAMLMSTGASGAQPVADIFLLKLFSSTPFVCPSTTENVGTKDKPASPDELSVRLGQRIFDTWNAMGRGKYDPLVGVDPPNPRAIFVIETHLSDTANFKSLIDSVYKERSEDWPFGEEGEESRIYLYCQGRTDFAGCSFDNARIYVMYKDDHDYDKYTAGSSLCGGNIQNDAVLYKSAAVNAYTHPIASSVLKFRDELPLDSPWSQERDAIVICVENI